MICINFQIATQSILMYHSVVKVKKNPGLEFFKIKLQSLIAILCARQVQVMPMQYFSAAC